MKRIATMIITALVLTAVMGLVACSGQPSSSSASASTSSGAQSSASASSSASSAASQSTSSASSNASSSSSSAASSSAVSAPATANGKQTATGVVETTTYRDRASALGISSSDFANDTRLLTLLVLDNPIEVTAYKGGSDYTGKASVICLPNDEMFRQFSGKQITISVDKWGEWPADIAGLLYDLVVDFDADGLDLVA